MVASEEGEKSKEMKNIYPGQEHSSTQAPLHPTQDLACQSFVALTPSPWNSLESKQNVFVIQPHGFVP